jgi:DNA-binding PadR family transcriptional regulator
VVPRERGTTKPLASTAFYVLLALADEDRYGLDIVRETAERTDGRVRLGPGTLYNAVKRMLSAGLIAELSASATAEEDPRRRYYRITAEGRRHLADETSRLADLVRAARAKDVLA